MGLLCRALFGFVQTCAGDHWSPLRGFVPRCKAYAKLRGTEYPSPTSVFAVGFALQLNGRFTKLFLLGKAVFFGNGGGDKLGGIVGHVV